MTSEPQTAAPLSAEDIALLREACDPQYRRLPMPERALVARLLAESEYAALASSGEAAPVTATCLTCGAPVIDPLAGSCDQCGAEDRHIGTQWLRMPSEQRPLSGEAAPDDGLRAALIQTADRAHRVGCRPLDGLRAEFFNTDWRVCRNDECVAIRAALARQGDDDD